MQEASFDSTSSYLAYSVVDTSGSDNGIYYRDLSDALPSSKLLPPITTGCLPIFRWDDHNHRLAFTQAAMDTTFETDDADIEVWNASSNDTETLIESSEITDGWALRTNNDLEWTDDGERLFFGLMSRDMVEADQDKKKDHKDSLDIYDREQILSEKGVDVWHSDDPRIKPHQKETWNRRKERTYRAVYHMDDNSWVQLADRKMPNLEMTQNPNYALGSSRVPYLQLMTWDYFYSDYYIVNLKSGERRRIAKKLPFGAELSPQGKFVVFYQDKDWRLYNVQEDVYRNLTEELDVPFYNEDHDYPYPTPGYDIAGWTQGDNSVLIYDKYDLWKFSTANGEAMNITEDGRDREISYRIQEFDNEREAFREDEELLVRGYYDHKKYYGFYTVHLDEQGTEQELETEHKYNFIAKPKDSDRIFYSREKYDEYPNVWMADDIGFDDTERLTDLHLDLHDKY
ncbi:MAG: hypothetical protein U5J63_15635 [Fodinibius sp.]|nr:hypothetical protein [Fodinibius sp.]